MNQDIAQLAAEAAAVDAETAPPTLPPAGAEPPALAVDPVAEAADLIRFAVALFVPLYPSLAAVYTEPAQGRLAQAAGPVMAKYGWTMGGLFEKWGPEINLAIVGIPLAIETSKAIRADTVARTAAKPADEEEGRPA